jgi:hypothetical protein
MEENKNISEEVIPTVEETVTEETQVVAEAPVVEAAPAIEEVIEEAPASKKVVAPVVAAPAADFDWDAYEKGITLTATAKEDLEKDNNKIKILEVDQNLDEKITRTSTEYENKYFIIDQISVLKTFNSNIDLNQFIFTKNKKENFVGWQVFNMKEINTRLAYNNDKDEYKELKFKEILELINY